MLSIILGVRDTELREELTEISAALVEIEQNDSGQIEVRVGADMILYMSPVQAFQVGHYLKDAGLYALAQD